ncbi:S-layer homology domain-containing protein [Collinsella tanakaei]|nr:S-layer homology domain-containing protein [Collinsella tanakaei]
MTACVNRKHTKKVAAVVTASLVGALSLGAAPVAAMAATDTGIETLATDTENVAKATPEYESSSTTFYYTGKGLGRVPVSVTDAAGQKHDIDLRSADIADGEFCYYYVEIDTAGDLVKSNGTVVSYYDGKVKKDLYGTSVKDAAGNYTMPVDKGDYAVVIAQYKGGQWYLRSIADTFSIVGFSLNDATLVDGRDVTDTVLEVSPAAGMSDGDAWVNRIGVAVGHHVLTHHDDYEMYIVRKDDGFNMAHTILVPGETYQAVINGTPEYEGHKVIDFQISKLDLSDATIIGKTIEDRGWWTDPDVNMTFRGLIQKINDVDNSNFDGTIVNDSQFDISLVSTPDGNEYNRVDPVKGKYTYKVTAKAGNPYFTGSKEFTIIYADNDALIDFSGCGDDIGGNVFYVNNSQDKPTIFDISHIKVERNLPYTVTVTDDEGNVIDMGGKTQLTEPGTYYVKVEVFHWDANGKLTASTDVAKVIVEYGGVYESTDIFMTYKGQNVVSSASDTYNGTDLSKNMAFTVKAGDKTLVQGTDYTVTFEKQAADGTRTVVDQIVDAGNYIITVDGKTFTETAEFTFRVDAVKPAYAVANWDIDADEAVYPYIDGYLMYTGEVLTPTFRFFDADGNEIEVPEGSYVVDRYEDEDGEEVELKKVGTYTAFFETAKDVVNFDFDGIKSTDINVTDKGVFMDVPMSGQWYSQVVYDAVNLGYMNGYSGTKFFGPNDSITRGQVACVLFNMAGGEDSYSEDLFDFSETFGYNTGFSDVNGKAYYGQAIAWAKATGVVNGYGDGTFKPDQAVTREEFAAMLSNYAEKLGDDVDGAEADLSAFDDASQVSDWATEAIEWAVANEVMGNGGFIAPTATITRAEAAAMAVNYQPEKLGDIVIDMPSNNVTPR